MRYTQHFSTERTSQDAPIPGSNMVMNNAGGFAYPVDDWKRLERFIILGSDGGSYYVGGRELTTDNAEAVQRCLKMNGKRVVDTVVELSTEGRAAKQDPALFVLAMAASPKFADEATRKYALMAMPAVLRTLSFAYAFAENAKQLGRTWSRQYRNGWAGYLTSMSAEKLAYQAVKYRQRSGWSLRDLLRKSHSSSEAHQDLFRWVAQEKMGDGVPKIIEAFTKLQAATTAAEAVKIIGDYQGVTWELVPTELLGDPKVWEALLPGMPMTAVLRNLARMTANGLIVPMSGALKVVEQKLADPVALKKARIHPVNVLAALVTYASGKSARGSLTWKPVQRVIDILDAAFYGSFGNLEATGKRIFVGLDVSGSMWDSPVAGMPFMNAMQASMAMIMAVMKTESNYHLKAFTSADRGWRSGTGLQDMNVSPRKRLDDNMHAVNGLNFGGTDCSLPILHALRAKTPVDVFQIWTDNETWAGEIHPSQALKRYRQEMGIPAKLVVCSTMSTDFSIADPSDAGMLDLVGFDSNVPSLIADFCK